MTGIWGQDSSVAFKTPKDLWIARGDGSFAKVRNAWIAKSDGSFAQVWPVNVAVQSFAAAKGSPSWSKVALTWSALNAVKVEVRLTGTSTVLYSGTGSSFTYSGLPGVTYKFTLRVYGAGSSFVDSNSVTVILDSMPAPATFRHGTVSSSGTSYTWAGVAGADGYEVVDTAVSGNPVRGSVGSGVLTFTENGLGPLSTTYKRGVRAKLGNSRSPISNQVSFTTPNPSITPKGTYFFKAVSMDVFSHGKNAWRGGAGGFVHGDGDNWSPGFGVNTTFFFYDLSELQAINGRVVGFGIRIKRDKVAGYSSPQGGHFYVHTYGTRPSGAPVYTGNANADAGSWAWGQDLLVSLPIAWGQAIVDNGYGSKGIAFGGVYPRYMRGPALSAFDWQGGLSITIG